MGLTLIEIIVVISIIGASAALIVSRTGIFSHWSEEAAIRKILNLISYLHERSMADQLVYRIDFSYAPPSYRVSVVSPAQLPTSVASGSQATVVMQACQSSGALSCEMTAARFASLSSNYTLMAPPDFPSLHEVQLLPADVSFVDIKTTRGVTQAAAATGDYLLFHPRGFSDFGVIHMQVPSRGLITLFVNPFSGDVELHEGEVDFDWTYGK